MGTFQDDQECIISPLRLSRCYFWLVKRYIKIILLLKCGQCAHTCVHVRVSVCMCVYSKEDPLQPMAEVVISPEKCVWILAHCPQQPSWHTLGWKEPAELPLHPEVPLKL